MLKGPENYLQMWERAVYGANDCVEDQATFQQEDLHALIGGNVEGFLTAIGQPIDRDGAVYTYCVEGEDGQTVPTDVVFSDDGTAIGVQPNDGSVQPAPAADPTGPASVNGTAGDGHDHIHASPAAAGAPLPTTGGGATNAALLLLGATLVLWSLQGRRRHAE